MSTKTSKRRQKRLNTNEEESETEKSISPKKNDEQNSKDNSIENDVSVELVEVKLDTIEEQNGHDIEENGQNDNHHEENNGFSDDKEEINLSIDDNIEDLLLVVDSDNESDKQLAVDVQEEITEREKTPALTTGMTTRSHNKSPKVDKIENGMDKIPDITVNDISVIEINETDEQTEENKEERVEEEEKDTTNASIFVNLGNDTTRNVDITSSVLEEAVSHSFVEVNKDIPYGQALRTLSGRRTLRRDSPFVCRYGKTNLDTTDARKSYVPHISSVKRKGIAESPEDAKRFKTEPSPGIFSYIASPINSFRNKLTRSELPSSTPKLMSYKYGQGTNIIDDMSKIDLEENAEPKKWCSIM